MRHYTLLSLSLTVLWLTACQEPGPETTPPGASWLDDAVVPIETLSMGSGFDDLLVLEQAIGSSRVVALGEIVHRAHEPLAFRNRLFEFLVEEMGFRVIAMETGLAESAGLRNFIRGGDVDLDEIAPEALGWGGHLYRENRELLQWIREYNQDAPAGDFIRFYGFELPGGTDSYFSRAGQFVERGLEYVATVDAESANSLRERIGPLLPFFGDLEYSALEVQERDALSAAINDLAAAIEQRRFDLIATSSDEQWAWEYQKVRTVGQLDDFLRLIPAGWKPTPEEPWLPNMNEAMTARDFGMWENVQWILGRERSERVFLFMHNAHLQNALNLRPEGPNWVLGQHLKSALDDDLYSVGTVHNSMVESEVFGVYRAGPSGLAQRLSQLELPLLFLDVRSQPWPDLEREWWTSGQPLDYGFQQASLSPATTYDAWVYLEVLSPYEPW
jgi:erythromycin esterase